ncbi:MAG: LytR/AlgR family response regulator transcription factor [Ruminococcus sp.]
MSRIAVVDDDGITLKQICNLLNDIITEEKVIELYDSSSAFFRSPGKASYNLVFLDIDMPEFTGFELAENLKSLNPDITIVFVSNLEHLVFQSFEYNPFGFVRKSYLESDIKAVVRTYYREISKSANMYVFRTNECTRKVSVSDILYFECMGHDIIIHTVRSSYKIKRDGVLNLKILSAQFEERGFIRVHRSFLINSGQIYTINRNGITLNNNEIISINPHKLGEIKDAYQRYLMTEA